MFFTLSKLLTVFLMPFTWLFFCLVMALFQKSHPKKQKYLWAGITIMLVFGNFWLAATVMKYWEQKPIILAPRQHYDVAIVLGGGIVDEAMKPANRVHFDATADRLLQAEQLYKSKKISKILISAGPLYKKHEGEAALAKKYLVETGIPEQDILVEKRSRNTHENALYSKKILEENGLSTAKLLLISSSYHLMRAQLCFQKEGLQTTPFPCDMQSTYSSFLSTDLIIPDEAAFGIWYDLLKEWFGLLMYKIMGYI